MRQRPGRITYASSGAGTITHLSAHLLASMAGAEATHVPYRGSGPAFADLLAGTVDMMVDTMASVIPAIRAGQVRALAVTTTTRSAALPEIPTAAEAGLPGYETYNWHAVFAHAATPAPILARLEGGDDRRGAAQARAAGAAGVEPRPEGSAALGAFWDQQLALWIPIIRSLRARPPTEPGPCQRRRARPHHDPQRGV